MLRVIAFLGLVACIFFVPVAGYVYAVPVGTEALCRAFPTVGICKSRSGATSPAEDQAILRNLESITGAAAGSIQFFGGWVTTILPCDFGVLVTLNGPHYNGLLMWWPPGGTPPYRENMGAQPIPSQCIIGIMSAPVVCTIGGEPYAKGPLIMSYGSSPPACSSGGAAGGGATTASTIGDALKTAGINGISSAFQQGIDRVFSGLQSDQSSPSSATTPTTPSASDFFFQNQCKSLPNGTPAQMRSADFAVRADLAKSCVTVAPPLSCQKMSTTAGALSLNICTLVGTSVGGLQCTMLSYLKSLCSVCPGAAIDVIRGSSSALTVYSGGNAVDVRATDNATLASCLLKTSTFDSLGKDANGFDTFRDKKTLIRWTHVLVKQGVSREEYWHICLPGKRC